jgi:hypothetical protein
MICFFVIVILVANVTKHSEWNDVMHVHATTNLLLGLATVTAFIAIALAGLARLAIPIWAIVINAASLPVVVILTYIDIVFGHPSSRTLSAAKIVPIALLFCFALSEIGSAIVAFGGKFTHPSRVLFAYLLTLPYSTAFWATEMPFCLGDAARMTLKYLVASGTRNTYLRFLRGHKKRLLLKLTEHLLRVRRGQQKACKAYQSTWFPSTTTTPSAGVIISWIDEVSQWV